MPPLYRGRGPLAPQRPCCKPVRTGLSRMLSGVIEEHARCSLALELRRWIRQAFRGSLDGDGSLSGWVPQFVQVPYSPHLS